MAWASLAGKITTRPSRPSSSKKEKRALPKRESLVSSVLFWHQSRVGPRQREREKKREINWGKRGNRRFWERNWCVPGKKMSLFSPFVTSHDISDYHHYWWATRFNFFCGELCFFSPNFPRKKCWRPQNIVQPHPSQFIFEVKGLKMIGATLYRTERPPIQHIKKTCEKNWRENKKEKTFIPFLHFCFRHPSAKCYQDYFFSWPQCPFFILFLPFCMFIALYICKSESCGQFFLPRCDTHTRAHMRQKKSQRFPLYIWEKNLWYISDEIPKHIAMSSGEEAAAVAAEAVRKELLNRR